MDGRATREGRSETRTPPCEVTGSCESRVESREKGREQGESRERGGCGAKSCHVMVTGSHEAMSREQPWSKEGSGHEWSALEMVAAVARGIQNKFRK